MWLLQRPPGIGKGFVQQYYNSKWVGLDNFKFLFSSKMPGHQYCTLQSWIYLYRFGCVSWYCHYPSELRLTQMVKILPQHLCCSPHFLSWAIISFFTDAFLNIDKGLTTIP